MESPSNLLEGHTLPSAMLAVVMGMVVVVMGVMMGVVAGFSFESPSNPHRTPLESPSNLLEIFL